MQGSGPLWDELHALLDAAAQPTPIHRFFASLPPLLRERGAPHQLIVTTSYDLALEQALLDAGEEFDVVSYIASGRHRGTLLPPRAGRHGGRRSSPEHLRDELSLERRTIILKLHGRFDPSPGREWESFVVTEDDYIEYLAQSDVSTSVPVGLAAKLQRSHFLFLGYTMADWNLRVVLKRLWGDHPLATARGRCSPRRRRSSASSGAASTSTCSSRRSTSTSSCRSSARGRRRRDARRCDAPREPVQGARAVRRLRARRAALLRARARRARSWSQTSRLAAHRPLRRRAASARARCSRGVRRAPAAARARRRGDRRSRRSPGRRTAPASSAPRRPTARARASI